MKRKIILLAAVVAIIVAIVLVLFPSPKATVASATIPGTTLNSGESAIIYRFTVLAENADVKIEQIYFDFQGASLGNLSFRDDSDIELPGAFYYNSEGTIRFWPGWPLGEKIVVPEGTTRVFNLRGNVIGRGALSIKIQGLVIEKGSVKGLPSIITTLVIK